MLSPVTVLVLFSRVITEPLKNTKYCCYSLTEGSTFAPKALNLSWVLLQKGACCGYGNLQNILIREGGGAELKSSHFSLHVS